MYKRFRVVPRLLDEEGRVLHECRVWETERNEGIFGARRWQWECTCKARGRYQAQSDAVSIFQWFRHAWRAENMPWPKDNAPAYKWYEAEKAA